MDDLEHWNLHDLFTGEEAAALACGMEPGNAIGPELYVVAAAMRRAYDKAANLLDTAVSWGDDGWEVYGGGWDSPNLLRSVAGRYVALELMCDHVVSPNDMEAAQISFERATFDRAELARWFRANGGGFVPKYPFLPESSASVDQATAQKPLSTRERNTLLRIIAVLAVSGFRIDPRAARNDKLGAIRARADELGLGISADTLRDKLNEALAMIENGRIPHSGD